MMRPGVFRDSGKAVGPHNANSPIDLRAKPHCYLCGGEWCQAGVMQMWDGLMRVVECQCGLVSFARFDSTVWKARGWKVRGAKRIS
jgi:hypothetical protein